MQIAEGESNSRELQPPHPLFPKFQSHWHLHYFTIHGHPLFIVFITKIRHEFGHAFPWVPYKCNQSQIDNHSSWRLEKKNLATPLQPYQHPTIMCFRLWSRTIMTFGELRYTLFTSDSKVIASSDKERLHRYSLKD